ncbi:MAG: DNA repair protein RadC [Proteobacteria bacterium]|nr:DNA repair protein RadC [Pseudomonadota bacterium]
MSSLRHWPSVDLPRERLRGKGAAALGDAELVALLIGAGGQGENALESSQRILREAGGLDRLAATGLGALAGVPGLGEAKASRILAAIELGLRVVERRSEAPQRAFCRSEEIWEAYRARLGALHQEVFLVVGLNNRNETLREEIVAKGTISECVVSPREVFRPMIAEAAARIVALHNHPSGDPSPSPEDVALTRRLAEAGALIGIPLLDHVVIGRRGYASLRDMGVIR